MKNGAFMPDESWYESYLQKKRDVITKLTTECDELKRRVAELEGWEKLAECRMLGMEARDDAIRSWSDRAEQAEGKLAALNCKRYAAKGVMGMDEYVLTAMVKVYADSPDDAYNKLYDLLCGSDDVGFCINEYAITGDKLLWMHHNTKKEKTQ